jgi:hypothetical protein
MTEKENFAGKLEEFATEFKEHISTDDGQWTVKGGTKKRSTLRDFVEYKNGD